MENTQLNKLVAEIAPESAEQKTSGRPRQLTTLKLQWLAERVRKVERIRKAVNEGTYEIDSTRVARAVLGLQED